MPIHKLRKLDETTYGVTLPKDDLMLEGIVGEDGELLEDEQRVVVDRRDDGQWSVERLDADTFPRKAD